MCAYDITGFLRTAYWPFPYCVPSKIHEYCVPKGGHPHILIYVRACLWKLTFFHTINLRAINYPIFIQKTLLWTKYTEFRGTVRGKHKQNQSAKEVQCERTFKCSSSFLILFDVTEWWSMNFSYQRNT